MGLHLSDPLGLRPLSDADLRGYRDAHRGGLAKAWDATKTWVSDHKEYIAAGAMVVAGVAASFIPVAGPALGGALISAGMSTATQQWQNGSVNWGRVAVDGAIGAFAGGAAGAVFKGASAALQEMNCLGRNILLGGASGATDGGVTGALQYLTGDGPKTIGGFFRSTVSATVMGGVTGGGTGGVLSKVTGQACFVADTQVLMADGSSKAIQDIAVGDEVLAWNHATGANESKRVVETFVHEGVETWEVETSDGLVTTTAEHPFYVEGVGWTPAKELRPGDVLTTTTGTSEIVRAESSGETARVFNFHVEHLHNYHVGAGEAWERVHNMCAQKVSPVDGGTRVSVRRFPKTAEPNQVLYRATEDGKVTACQTYDADGLPVKRVDVDPSSNPHAGIPAPHVQEYVRDTNPATGQVYVNTSNRVRPALPEEVENLGWDS